MLGCWYQFIILLSVTVAHSCLSRDLPIDGSRQSERVSVASVRDTGGNRFQLLRTVFDHTEKKHTSTAAGASFVVGGRSLG